MSGLSSNEKYFPRGGVHKLVKRVAQENEGDLTVLKPKKKSTADDHRPVKKKRKRDRGEKDDNSNEGNTNDGGVTTKPIKVATESIFVPEKMTLKKIAKGTLMLAAVKSIGDYELRLNLPNNVIGVVSITDMADAYTTELKKFAQSSSQDTAGEDMHSLDELFNVGQYLPCISLNRYSEGMTQLKVSVNPKLVNQQVSIEALVPNQVIYGAVAGEEDHGYFVDLGLKDLQAFLRKEESSYADGLLIGDIRRFRIIEADLDSVKSGDKRTIAVSIHDANSEEVALSEDDMVFRNLLPGQLVEGILDSRCKEGATFEIGSLKAHAHITHLPGYGKDFTADGVIKFRVLAVNSVTKYIHVTCLPSLMDGLDDLSPPPLEYELGDMIQATFSKMADRYAFLSLPDSTQTYIGSSLLSQDQETSIEPNQTKLKCYWLAYDYLESKAILSTKKPPLKKSLLPGLIIGQNVDAEITHLDYKGAKVKMENGLYAFIQSIFLTEFPLKNPERKFQERDRLSCKILSVDLVKKRVRLTSKPSMVRSELPIIDSYDNVKVGALVHGVITKLTTGALVVFYNGVSGFVPNSQLAKHPVPNPAELFYVGQAVKCRVTACTAQEHNLKLTFLVDDKQRKEYPTDRDRDSEIVAQIGEIVKSLTVTKVVPSGVVFRSSQGLRGFIPTAQLSDFPSISVTRKAILKEGDKIAKAICLDTNNIFSSKFSRIYYAEKIERLTGIDDVQVGKIYPASVVSVSKFGIFVDLGVGVNGIAPYKWLPSGHAVYGSQPSLKVGQSVLAKVVSCNTETERLAVSLRERDVIDDDGDNLVTAIKSQFIQQYVQEMDACNEFASNDSEAIDYKVGDVVSGTVCERQEESIVLEMDNGVRGLATGDMMLGCSGEESNRVEGIVTFVDVLENKIQLNVVPSSVQSMKDKDAKANSSSEDEEPQCMATVIAVRDEYSLVILNNNAHGNVAFVSTRLHPNSVHTTDLCVGQSILVAIQGRLSNGCLFGTQKAQPSQKKDVVSTDLCNEVKIGKCYKANVIGVEDLRIILTINGLRGVAKMEEITDEPVEGTKPTRKYKPGDEVNAIVTKVSKKVKKHGDKDVKFHCSLRLSKINAKSLNGMRGPKLLQSGHITGVYVERVEMTQHRRLLHVVSKEVARGTVNLFEHAPVKAELVLKYSSVGTYMRVIVGDMFHRRAKTKDLYRFLHSPLETQTTKACIVSVQPLFGIIVSVPYASEVRIPWSELAESGQNIDLESFQEGKFFTVNIYQDQNVIGLRKTSNRMPLSSVSPGSVHAGIISHVGDQECTVSVVGHQVEIKMNEDEFADFEDTYKLGNALWVKMERQNGCMLHCSLCPTEDIPQVPSLPSVHV